MNLDRVVSDVILNPQTTVPASFLVSTAAKFIFKIPADKYRIMRLALEFDLTNTDSGTVQAAPSPFLIDRIRIKNGSGNPLQEILGEEIYAAFCLTYNQERRTSMQSIMNLNATTFGAFASVATGGQVTYSIPLSLSFLEQCKIFLGGLSQSGLEIEVVSRGPQCMVSTGNGTGFLSMSAARLRVTAEYMSPQLTEQLIAEHKREAHLYKYLDTNTQSFPLVAVTGNTYSLQLQSLNGLVPFGWFTLRQSLIGAGNYTYTAITQHELKDQSNVSLYGGFPVPDFIARGPMSTENFDSDFLATQALNPMYFVQQPMPLLGHPINVGAQAFINNYLSVTAASTATSTLDVYVLRWTSILVKPDGSLLVMSS
jgi:hypothetical protein